MSVNIWNEAEQKLVQVSGNVNINDSIISEDSTFSSKKINDSLVDIESMIDGVYTEEEKVVGKWIDGKPIYRKVYKITLSTGLVTIGNIANVDTYLGCKGSYLSSSNNKLAIPWIASNEYTNVLINTLGNVRTTSNLGGRNCVFAIEYTKTTD